MSEIKSGGSSYTVTVIEQSAFEDCKKLESISIPGTVTILGQVKDSGRDNPNSGHSSYVSVFKDCTNLKKVRFEDGEAELKIGSTYCSYRNVDGNLGRGMFADCPLEEIYLGRNLIGIDHPSGYNYQSYPDRYGYSPFYTQSNLSKVVIGDNVTSMPNYLFYKCSGLKLVDFGKNLINVSKSAFEGCSSLTAALLPSTVRNIYESAFKDCTSISQVNLGSTRYIYDNAFYNNTSLVHVVNTGFLYGIMKNALYNTPLLRDFEFSAGLSYIQDLAFAKSGLKSGHCQTSVDEFFRFSQKCVTGGT